MLNRQKRPLSIRIPGDYAEKLGIHESTLSRVNSGGRGLPLDKAVLLVLLSENDPRLKGLSFYDLCPDLIIAHKVIYGAKLPKRLRK
jgi:hypothetical protein